MKTYVVFVSVVAAAASAAASLCNTLSKRREGVIRQRHGVSERTVDVAAAVAAVSAVVAATALWHDFLLLERDRWCKGRRHVHCCRFWGVGGRGHDSCACRAMSTPSP